MATRLPAPDYSGRDYTSALTRLQRLVQSVFPQWTDFNRANFGNILLKCMAFIVDVISKYTDFMATESLPEYAQLRRSVQAHTRWIGYELSGRTAATATERFILSDGAHSNDVTITAGSIIRVADIVNPIEFQLLADVTITAGNTEASGTVEHSENAQDIEGSTGGPSQVFRLTQEPYIDDSMVVVASDGAYTKPANNNFLDSGPTDKHFVISIDDEERPLVRFGDGLTGKIPQGTITFDYKVGGGLEGNVDAATIIEIVDGITDVLGNPISVSATNDAAASGGADPETLAHAKQQAPAELRVLNRTIAREDYEIGARNVSSVATALFLTSDDTVLIRENEGVGWVLEVGDETPTGKFKIKAPSSATLRSVEEYWRTTKPRPLGFYTRAVGDSGDSLKTVTVRASVYLSRDADKSTPVLGQPTVIGAQIFTALNDFFAPIAADGSLETNVDWGFNVKGSDGLPVSEVSLSDVYDVINGTAGVRKIDCGALLLNGTVGDVSLRLWEFPVLGSVTIINAEDNTQLYPAP